MVETVRFEPVSAAMADSGDREKLDTSFVIPEKLCNLPPFHAVASQIFSLSIDPDADLRKIAMLIESDVAFASEILALANSPLFGFPAKVSALKHAVAILGLERMKTLAVTVAMRALMGKSTPMIRLCWRHTVACALISQRLSVKFAMPPDRGYTAGLMHDVGRLGLLKSYPTEIAPVFNCSYQNSTEVLRVERSLVHVDHGGAGAWLLKVWAFPEEFSEICEHHHDPLRQEDPALLKLVKVGCHLADASGFAAVQYGDAIDYDAIFSTIGVRIGRNGFPTLEDLKDDVEERLSAFGE
jgi:HD-like signal output (HDOD) protein